MHRICTSLAENGYAVTLIGRKLPASLPLHPGNSGKKGCAVFLIRENCFMPSIIPGYSFSIVQKNDAICPSTLIRSYLPVYFQMEKHSRIYDAHELFTGLKEVATRPRIKKVLDRDRKKKLFLSINMVILSAKVSPMEFNRRLWSKLCRNKEYTRLREFNARLLLKNFFYTRVLLTKRGHLNTLYLP